MKKSILYSAFAILGFGTLVLTGCSKDEDTTAPSLSLTGGTSITVSLPTTAGGAGTWSDPGFSALDDEDGNITSSVTVTGASAVNLNRKGSYTVSYSVSDKAGNSTSVDRVINVVNDAEVFAGSYATCTDSSTTFALVANFAASCSTSDTINNLVKVVNFGAFDSTGTYPIYIKFDGVAAGSAITLNTNNQFVGAVAQVTQIYPTGTGVVSGTAPTSFDITYQWTDGTATDIAVSKYRR
ncbi:MAG TPA: DUF5011 domain-containing protein [Bacteroidia bacterium]|mgnify:FL=1|nr:DUF5011 domain-containing protein [Bacteroidia bacterium]